MLLRVFIIVVTFTPAVGDIVQGQPVLEFKRVVNLWPKIETYFAATCNGQFIVLNDTANISLKEDGFSVKNVTLHCPDPNSRCFRTVALAFDVSSSIASSLSAIKNAGVEFVDSMDGLFDEATVISYVDGIATVQQSMTTSKTSLNNAIASLSVAPSNDNHPHGPLYRGVWDIINEGNNSCKAVILVCDGYNLTSYPEWFFDFLPAALQNNIKLFTIAVNVPNTMQSLELFAQLTGGRYYDVTTATVLSAFQEIDGLIRRGFDECSATYQSTCADGSVRTVELSVKNICGGSTSRTKTYQAPRDTSTWRTIDIRPHGSIVRPPDTIVIPVELYSSLSSDEHFFPGNVNFTLDAVGFNPSEALTFLDVVTPPGTLLSQAGISYLFSQNTLTLSTSAAVSIQGNGTLCYLRFLPKPLESSAQVTLRMNSWSFTRGCLRILPAETEIMVLPPTPDLVCGIQTTTAVALDYVNLDYTPNPFPVKVNVINNGQYPVMNATARIIFDTTYFGFALASDVEQIVSPETIQPGSQASTTWYLGVKRQRTDDTAGIRVEVLVKGNKEAECEKKIIVPSAKQLRCTVMTSALGVDSTTGYYTPSPIIVTSVLTNTGIEPISDPVANLLLPPEAVFAGSNQQTGVIRPLSKKHLQPLEDDTVQWAIDISVQVPPKNVDLSVEAYSLVDPVMHSCFSVINLPRSVPVLEVATRKERVTIDTVRGGYAPLPFTLGGLVTNTGFEAAENTTVTLNLSSGLQLAPGETATKSLPSSLSTRNSDSVFWQVLAAPASINRALPFSVLARSDRSIEAIARDSVLLPPVFPVFDATCTTPAKLVRTGPSGTFTPNPFTVEIHCRNVGTYEARNVRATLALPQDVELVTPTEPLTKTFTPSTMGIHQSGDPIPMLSWQVRYTGNPQADMPLRFQFIINATNPLDTVAMNYGPLICSTMVRIDTVSIRFECDIDAPDRLTSNGRNLSPNPASITYSIVNLAGTARTLERVKLDISQADIDSVAIGSPLERTPRLLMQHGDTMRFTWIVAFSGTLNQRNVPLLATAHFDFDDSVTCMKSLAIEPLTVEVLCSLGSSASLIRYRADSSRYEPQTFVITTEVENTGSVRLTNVRAMLEWTDPSGLSLIGFDPNYPDNSNPKRSDALESGEKETFDWGLRIAPNVVLQDTVRLCFTLRYWSDQTPAVANACLSCVTVEPKSTVEVKEGLYPESVMLHPNHPNPANDETTISFTLSQKEIIQLEILDLLGRRVSLVAEGLLGPGSHRFRANTSTLNQGVYAIILYAGSKIYSHRMIVVR